MNSKDKEELTNDYLVGKYKLYFQEEIKNSLKLEEKIKKAFPIERDPHCEYFCRSPFVEDIEEMQDYLFCRSIFFNKNWTQVNFDELYNTYIQHLYLNGDGFNYYIPAFLKYFYNLRHSNLLFFDYIIGDLAVGCVSTRYRIGEDGRSYLVPTDYSEFEKFTPAQSQLIAAFLLHVAILNDSYKAQCALKNYWGKFLLI